MTSKFQDIETWLDKSLFKTIELLKVQVEYPLSINHGRESRIHWVLLQNGK